MRTETKKTARRSRIEEGAQTIGIQAGVRAIGVVSSTTHAIYLE